MSQSSLLANSGSRSYAEVLQVVSTTTLYLGGQPPTQTASESSSNNKSAPLPIASIAGGAAAGIFLAIVAVIGWTWWGRCIKRKEEKKWIETHNILTTRENTRRNAASSSPQIYMPSAPTRKAERKVKFVPSLRRSRSIASGGEETVPFTSETHHIASHPTDEQAYALPNYKMNPSWKDTMPPSYHSAGSLPFGSETRVPAVRWGKVPGASARPPLAHKPSTLTVSSASVYSTQSAEPHQVRGSLMGNGILTTLGYTLDPRRLSTWTRSSGSVYSTPEELHPISSNHQNEGSGVQAEDHPEDPYETEDARFLGS